MSLPTDRAEREEAARLVDAVAEAHMAYSRHPVSLLLDDDGDVQRCAATGIPITIHDETVEDVDTGEIWLRAALGLPPREGEDEGDDIEDAA